MCRAVGLLLLRPSFFAFDPFFLLLGFWLFLLAFLALILWLLLCLSLLTSDLGFVDLVSFPRAPGPGVSPASAVSPRPAP